MSAIVNGPKNGSRKPNDDRTTSSTCSGPAMPSSTIRAASLNIANWIRLATNPGPSPTTTGVLPSRVSASTTMSTTPSSVDGVRMTSTQGTSSGGTNQWTPRKRLGLSSPAASSAIGNGRRVRRDHGVAGSGLDLRVDGELHVGTLDDGFDDEIGAVHGVRDRRRRREVLLRRRRRATVDVPCLLQPGEELDRAAPRRLGQRGRRVDEHGRDAARGEHVRDADAHRPGADDGDPGRPGAPGTGHRDALNSSSSSAAPTSFGAPTRSRRWSSAPGTIAARSSAP